MARTVTSVESEVGGVYAIKKGAERAAQRHGLQANRYDGDGHWSIVVGFCCDKGFSWLTEPERERRLSTESVVDRVYTERTALKQVIDPVEAEVGWCQKGPAWRQRKEVVFINGKWVNRELFELEARRTRALMRV